MDDLYDEVNNDGEDFEEFAGLGELSADEVNKSFMNNDVNDDETESIVPDVPAEDNYKPVSFDAEKVVEESSSVSDDVSEDAFKVENEDENISLPEMVDEKVSEEEVEEESYRDVNDIMSEAVTVKSDNDISGGASDEDKNKLSEMAYEEVMQEINGTPVAQGKTDYKCPNCLTIYAGGEKCPFCGNIGNEIKKDPEARTADLMIQFKITKKEAIKLFNKENRFRLLTPFGFKKNIKKGLVGMYLPYYLVDANSSGAVLYKARDIKRTEDDKYQYKERKNYMVKLSGNFDFNKMLFDVASKFPDKLNDYIFPYNLEEVIVYDENIIDDEYYIVRCNIEDEEMGNKIKNKVLSSSVQELNKSVRHDKMKVENNALNVKVKDFKYVMLPIYLSMVTYKGKKYVFCVNGSTGKYISRVPLDSTKVIFVGVIILLVIFFIALGIAILI